jgi:hypothetical protein
MNKKRAKERELKLINIAGSDNVREFDSIIGTATYEVLNDVKDHNKIEIYNPMICRKVIDNHEYLASYCEYMDILKSYYVVGCPDTFIKAACLCKALVKNKIIKFEIKDIRLPKDLLLINYRIAFYTALKLISNPVVYKNSMNGWDRIELGPCDIKIPEGYVPNDNIENRIISSMSLNNIYDYEIDTLELSNLLHLIYAYNIESNKHKDSVLSKK